MPAAPWLFLAVSAIGAWFTWNAFRPIFRPASIAVGSFFAGWLTAELAMHHFAWQLAATALLVWLGALHEAPGWAALALTVLSWIGLYRLVRGGLGAEAVIDAVLTEALGPEGAAEAERRRAWRKVILPFASHHADVTATRNVIYSRIGKINLKLDVYRSATAPARAPALVFVHGGAWILGKKDHHGVPLMKHMASRGWVCFGVDYRLSPRATFPDHIVDVLRAIAWVREHAAEYGVDPDFIIVAGGSAGGHLSALAALAAGDPAFQPGFESADTHVSGCVALYGIYDFEDRDRVWPHRGLLSLLERHVMKAPIETSREMFERASPIRRISPDAPPFFVIHGDADTLVPVEGSRRFVTALRAASRAPVAYAELPGAQHAFEVFPSLRSIAVYEGIERFCAALHARHVAARPLEGVP